MQLRDSDATNLAGQTDEQLGRRHLRQSSIALLLACPRKFDLSQNQGLELIETPRPLSLGSAFQKAIEMQDPAYGVHALRGETPCDFCEDGEQRIGPDDWVPCENCDRSGWVQTGVARNAFTQEQEDRLLVDEAIVEAASAAYLRKWPAGTGETREFNFRVRLRSPWSGAYSRTFDLVGTADGVVDDWADPTMTVDPANCPFELIENKLVGQITPQKVQRLPLDRQVAIYRYGIWRATGRRVETVRYRWTRKPQIRQKQNETIEEYAERIRNDYVERPDFYLVEQEPQFATTGDLLRIEAELWVWAEQIRHAERQRLYPRNTAACGDYGGCMYIPVCSGDPDAMSLYHRRDDQHEPAEAHA
jgi:hypothetical protein